jgi:hypothetical protein
MTEDMAASYAFLNDKQIEIIGQVEAIGSVSFLTFKDPDNNLLMVCERKKT